MEATLSKCLCNLERMLEATVPYMRGKRKTSSEILSIMAKYNQNGKIEERTWGTVVESQNIRVSVTFHRNGIVHQTKINSY